MLPKIEFEIVDLQTTDTDGVAVAAGLLHTESVMHWPEAWPTMTSAKKEIRRLIKESAILRYARSQEGDLLGWIGGENRYTGHTWELQPLVVHPEYRLQGIGRALVADLEEQVLLRGGENLYLRTIDEDGRTSLANTELYPRVVNKLKDLKNTAGHPFEFYQSVGFEIVGVIPHARGYGKPDFIMSKRLRTR